MEFLLNPLNIIVGRLVALQRLAMNYTLAAKLPTIAAILKKNREFLGLIPFFLVCTTKHSEITT